MKRAHYCLYALALATLAPACSSTTREHTVQNQDRVTSAADKVAYDFFVAKGLTKFQSAGIVGNLDQESQMNPAASQPGGPGRGIAQWSAGGRWDTDGGDNAVWYAGTRGESVGSLNLQLEFIWYELQTFPAFGLAQLRATTNLHDAVLAFEDRFEQCGGCDLANRESYAQATLDAFGNDGPPPPPSKALEIAFQANTSSLWTVGDQGTKDWQLGLMAGTSPAIAALATGGYEVAFQSNNGELWTAGTAGTTNWHLGMAAGTSPSIAALPGGGFEVAFQANTSSLWTVGDAGNRDTGLGMAAGTSPSITALSGGGIQVAFQANTGSLWSVGDAGNGDRQYGMAPGTSPAIAGLVGGGYEIAFQANTGSLWSIGNGANGDLGLGMAAGTSPAIAALNGAGSYQIAFQANTGSLWTTGTQGTWNWNQGMMAKTSPGIGALPDGGFRALFQANTGSLYKAGTGSDGVADLQLGMMNGTSPSGM